MQKTNTVIATTVTMYYIEYALEMDSNQLDVIGGVFIAFKWNTNDSTHIVCCRLFSYCIGMV